jgi:hypothetical protein
VTTAYGRTLQSFVEEFGADHSGSLIHAHSPSIHLGYRFLALAKYRATTVVPAENMAWLFLFLHQLIYETTAIQYPSQCGMAGKSSQQIQTQVNQDLASLSRAKFGKDLSRNDRKNNKVCCLEFRN